MPAARLRHGGGCGGAWRGSAPGAAPIRAAGRAGPRHPRSGRDQALGPAEQLAGLLGGLVLFEQHAGPAHAAQAADDVVERPGASGSS